MTAADVMVVIGFALAMAGMTAAFGWPWSAMAAGCLLLLAGARLQQGEKDRSE